jgi:hypothetical protein
MTPLKLPTRKQHARTAWLDADVSRLGEYERCDWGPKVSPAADPIFWDAASGQFMVQEAG